MSPVADAVLPVFSILALGYAAARLKWFDEAASRGLALFVFNFAVPFLLFDALADTELPNPFPWGFWVAYYASALATFATGMAVGGLWRRPWADRALGGFTASFSNTVLLGVPLILGALGEAASLPVFLLIALHPTIMMTAVTVLLEVGSARQSLAQLPLRVAKGLVSNPVIIGLGAGIAAAALDFTPPKPLAVAIAHLGDAVTPCALFSLGVGLSRYRIKGQLGMACALTSLKLLFQPLLVWGLLTWVFTVETLWLQVAVLMAAMPTGVNSYLFAQRYGTSVEVTTTAVFLSTMASMVTLSALVALLTG
ncbi:MAG: AEC family transporter [Candidatus Competibacterales bacterium]